MKKAVAAQVSLVALALASGAYADGPPAGGSLQLVVGGATGSAAQYSGGNAQVVQSANQASQGRTIYLPLSLEVGTGAPSGFYKWVADTAMGATQSGPRPIELDSFDATGKNISILKLAGAVITQIDFPALSKSDNSAATLRVQIAEQSSSTGGTPHPFEKRASAAWTKSSFDATLAGVPGATSAIGASSVVFDIPAMPSSTGQMTQGAPRLRPFHLIFDPSSTKALQVWMGQGKAGPTTQTAYASKDVKIIYRAVAREKVPGADLFTASFRGCGPMSVTPLATSVDVEIGCKSANVSSAVP